MDKRKRLGKFMILLPIILFLLPLLTLFIDDSRWQYSATIFADILFFLYMYSIPMFFTALVIGPIYILIGIYLLIRYRDNQKPIWEIIKGWFNFEERYKNSQFYKSPKSVKTNILVLFLIISPVIIIFLIINTYTLKMFYSESTGLSSRFTEIEGKFLSENLGREEVTKNWLDIIPEKYEVIDREGDESNLVDGCVIVYEIYPRDYSEIEKEYLNSAYLFYCPDRFYVKLKGQTGDVSYNFDEKRWLYIEGDTRITQQEESFGNRVVTVSELGGSHTFSRYYIAGVENTKEFAILSIPFWNRIRCESYDEDGVETMNEDCVNFRDSLPTIYIDRVPEEIYHEYYDDLLKILGTI